MYRIQSDLQLKSSNQPTKKALDGQLKCGAAQLRVHHKPHPTKASVHEQVARDSAIRDLAENLEYTGKTPLGVGLRD
ncbi:hypothetical protein OUZ56_011924 [Daphnia magna]|uniref:Uncharacterized protein n=1 Tax=Daphnia magna TaxID=35525 RepID=A0ABQ9Z1J0_9CRUS|nr:hypothetical protein OUZ56_011924 [Daphnia magna]